jgi:hypothetical protein
LRGGLRSSSIGKKGVSDGAMSKLMQTTLEEVLRVMDESEMSDLAG